MGKKEFSCCFTGHRAIDEDAAEAAAKRLDVEIRWMAASGVKDFYAGGALGFDTLAARAVLNVRETDPEVKLHLLLPCPEQTKFWSSRDTAVYREIFEMSDSQEYLSEYYHPGVMQIRNRALVDASAYCICYFDPRRLDPTKKSQGGTYYTVRYAKSQGLTITNLCELPDKYKSCLASIR